MRGLQRFFGILFALLVWTGCQNDPGVADRHCAYRLDCGWEDDFSVCRQSIISSTAALTYVYGEECGQAWLDLLDCESSLECDDYWGCQEEDQRFDTLCF
jgi:hypothetical protein